MRSPSNEDSARYTILVEEDHANSGHCYVTIPRQLFEPTDNHVFFYLGSSFAYLSIGTIHTANVYI